MIIDGFYKAYQLLIQPSVSVWQPLFRTLKITGTATFITMLIGIPIGLFLGFKRFKGRSMIVSLINSAMGLPPVIVGLFVSLLFWRSGVLGGLGLMYTSKAMVIAELIIALPLVVGLTFASVQDLNPKLKWQIISLGASNFEFYKKILIETRIAISAAVIAGFGGIISEVGAAMMVGGNIEGQTRVLTTAIVLETRSGHFDKAIALSVILLSLALLISIFFTSIQQKEGRQWNRMWF